MIRRHSITYTALRTEAVRVSMEIVDDEADPGNLRYRPVRNARPVPADASIPTRHDERDQRTDWRDKP